LKERRVIAVAEAVMLWRCVVDRVSGVVRNGTGWVWMRYGVIGIAAVMAKLGGEMWAVCS